MLLALGVLCFSLGFIVAAVVTSRPKETREVWSSLNDSLKGLRHLEDASKLSAPFTKEFPINDDNKYLMPTDDANLLTKYGKMRH